MNKHENNNLSKYKIFLNINDVEVLTSAIVAQWLFSSNFYNNKKSKHIVSFKAFQSQFMYGNYKLNLFAILSGVNL